MCGRFVISNTGKELVELFNLLDDGSAGDERRFNVAPSQSIPVVKLAEGRRVLARMRWGLIPFWSGTEKATAFINARAETAATKPAFRDSFKKRRCLIPAAGFYEWKRAGTKKQPYFIRPRGGGILAYAGIWDRWEGPDGPVESAAILTVPSNELVQPLHDRMPAIIRRESYEQWLGGKETKELQPLLATFPAGEMECWPVSDRVNSARVEEPGLNEPLPEPAKSARPANEQPNLFDER